MSRSYPIYGIAISEDCKECEEKLCKKQNKYKEVCIGIDQSYKNTGVSLSADGKLLKVKSINLESCKNNSEKRKKIIKALNNLISQIYYKADKIICVIERIRLRSQGFLNIDYIKSIGALNATIIDVMYQYGIEVYSVDTRCWKSQVIGTSKPKANKFGVPDEKWPTVEWIINKGFEESILIEIEGRKTKGTFERHGKKYMYNNDASDSAGISMFYFLGDKEKLQLEK